MVFAATMMHHRPWDSSCSTSWAPPSPTSSTPKQQPQQLHVLHHGRLSWVASCHCANCAPQSLLESDACCQPTQCTSSCVCLGLQPLSRMWCPLRVMATLLVTAMWHGGKPECQHMRAALLVKPFAQAGLWPSHMMACAGHRPPRHCTRVALVLVWCCATQSPCTATAAGETARPWLVTQLMLQTPLQRLLLLHHQATVAMVAWVWQATLLLLLYRRCSTPCRQLPLLPWALTLHSVVMLTRPVWWLALVSSSTGLWARQSAVACLPPSLGAGRSCAFGHELLAKHSEALGCLPLSEQPRDCTQLLALAVIRRMAAVVTTTTAASKVWLEACAKLSPHSLGRAWRRLRIALSAMAVGHSKGFNSTPPCQVAHQPLPCTWWRALKTVLVAAPGVQAPELGLRRAVGIWASVGPCRQVATVRLAC